MANELVGEIKKKVISFMVYLSVPKPEKGTNYEKILHIIILSKKRNPKQKPRRSYDRRWNLLRNPKGNGKRHYPWYLQMRNYESKSKVNACKRYEWLINYDGLNLVLFSNFTKHCKLWSALWENNYVCKWYKWLEILINFNRIEYHVFL